MLYLIGLGLNQEGITNEGQEALRKCHKIYLEGYTVDFPYNIQKLTNGLTSGKKKVLKLNRKDVESNKLIKEAKGRNIALLVYGSPLFATTHMTLILDAKEQGIDTKVVYNASIFDGIANIGLQLYKFGKIASMPAWKKNYEPDSFMDVVKENQSIKAHSLILCDIGLESDDALQQLVIAAKNKKIKLEKVVICSKIGTEDVVIEYNEIDELRGQDFDNPFCIIIPSEMHFLEKRAIESF